MPRIPSEEQLGTVIPRRARGNLQHAPIDRSSEIRAQTGQTIARGLNDVADVGFQFQQKEDQFNYARAKALVIKSDVDLQKSFEGDDDFETYEQRYTEGMTKAREKASELIRSKNDRALFDLDSEMDVSRGANSVRGFSKKKEADWGRATLDETLEGIRADAIRSGDEVTRSQAIDAAKDMIIGAENKGYFGEFGKEAATQRFQAFRDSAVTGYIEAQPADKQIEILGGKNNVADYLQPDVRAKLLDRAKNENKSETIKRESQVATKTILAKHPGDWKSALTAAKEIEDAEIQDATVSRIKQEWQVSKELESEYRDNQLEHATAFIAEGGKFADMPLKMKSGLKPSTLNSLRGFAEQGAQVKKTDPALIGEITDKLGEGYQAFGDMDSSDWQFRMTPADFEQYKLLQAKVKSGNLDGKDTGFLTIAQLRGNKANELFKGNSNAEKRNKFLLDFDARLAAAKEFNGGKVRSDDAKKILDEMTAEVVLKDTWFNTKKKAYELSDEDVPGVPAADRVEIIRSLRKAGKPVTDEEIARVYRGVSAR